MPRSTRPRTPACPGELAAALLYLARRPGPPKLALLCWGLRVCVTAQLETTWLKQGCSRASAVARSCSSGVATCSSCCAATGRRRTGRTAAARRTRPPATTPASSPLTWSSCATCRSWTAQVRWASGTPRRHMLMAAQFVTSRHPDSPKTRLLGMHAHAEVSLHLELASLYASKQGRRCATVEWEWNLCTDKVLRRTGRRCGAVQWDLSSDPKETLLAQGTTSSWRQC